MEILIDVPQFLTPFLEWLSSCIDYMYVLFARGADSFNVVSASLEDILNLPRSVFLPIMGVLFVFWPVLLYLVMTLAAAWMWIFWLLISIIFGLIQLVYVTYHFIMIACDIFGISVLKSYSMLRRQVLYYLDLSGNPIRQKTRRRVWRTLVEQAGSYENFLKIRLLPKKVVVKKVPEKDKQDTALPPVMTRSNSTGDWQRARPVPTSASFPKNMSLNNVSDVSQVKGSKDPDIQTAQEELGEMTTSLLISTAARVKEARMAADEEARANTCRSSGTYQTNVQTSAAGALEYTLSGIVKRNHLALDDALIGNARCMAESGRYGLSGKSRQLIRSYYEQVEKGLDWLAEAPVQDSHSMEGFPHERHGGTISDRINLVRKMKQNMGRTALMLSGGGAQGMYHMGSIRALIESKLYDDIKVISGTSGGSIVAAMCAIKTSSELFTEVCVPNISTDYRSDGRMKREKISWFPPVTEMASNWYRKGLLMDNKEFRRTCEFYYADTTFEEAFDRTGKHVCITVSASRATGDTAQRLLLNHISTPHVTIASAVAASCALPGVMAPAKLISKNSSGVLEAFEVDGVEWIDGSVQADLPFERIATMFAITSFIVSQTNFHVVPFLNKAHHPSQESLYWRLFQSMEWDLRNRALKLSKLGLFPKIFGQDISKVFKQKYYGNLTIVPRFTAMQAVGLKVLSDPSVKDMEGYLKNGQIATWPYLNVIRDMIRLEKALDECLSQLESRARAMQPDWSTHDDVDVLSIASSSNVAFGAGHRVRVIGLPPSAMVDSERVRQRVGNLKHENTSLRKKVEELEKRLAQKEDGEVKKVSEVEEDQKEEGHGIMKDGAEGAVWNIVHGRSDSGVGLEDKDASL